MDKGCYISLWRAPNGYVLTDLLNAVGQTVLDHDVHGMFSEDLRVLSEFSKGSPLSGHVPFSHRKQAVRLHNTGPCFSTESLPAGW